MQLAGVFAANSRQTEHNEANLTNLNTYNCCKQNNIYSLNYYVIPNDKNFIM